MGAETLQESRESSDEPDEVPKIRCHALGYGEGRLVRLRLLGTRAWVVHGGEHEMFALLRSL